MLKFELQSAIYDTVYRYVYKQYKNEKLFGNELYTHL